MKKLILVRHGDYEKSTGKLNPFGNLQIKGLSGSIKDLVGDKSVIIFSSTAPRTIDSAEIISTMLKTSYQRVSFLRSGGGYVEDFPATHKLVLENQEKADVIILVTHYEYVEDFPDFFSQREFSSELRGNVIGKGSAWLIDCKAETLTLIN